ncbi:MAG: hypothetical protein OH319_03840 [Candidatus Parvarchaeota archaeon]|nr:hypothetical protein [Candidatus Jingweiarchaeum tengchongense]MCW1298612.1 hypothetical protein [Candidatus Jingweiarchaeum tengchongense]MCW1300458.1 hypothetical protein [Candidatus Jingweiarchaeum tengchongense]MCW1304952.1 hypothetical protein [Candidatus Jingweiarchaeum tengchongense]MCW1305488.1 hypothetical protein [Candidatus Jingweiarchaeum tengchongense]
MMRRKDVEEMLGRRIVGYEPIKPNIERVLLSQKSLEDYVKIFDVPRLAKKVITGKPLIVVHPGFSIFFNFQDSKSREYETYMKNMKKKVDEALSNHRCVIITYPNSPDIEARTRKLFNDPKNVIWVPDPTIDHGFSVIDFYERLGRYVDSVDLAGERGCAETHEHILKQNKIKVNRLEDCLFIPRY